MTVLRLAPTLAILLTLAAADLRAEGAGSRPDVAGAVHGLVRSAEGMGPVAGARVVVVAERGGRVEVLGRARTDARGRFRVETGPRTGPATLHVAAADRAPARRSLRPNPGGEGILLDDIVLERGAPLTVRLDLEGLAEDVLRGLVLSVPMLPESGSRLVDLDAEPLFETRFDGEGRASVPHLASGPCVLLVHDRHANVVPRLLVWRGSGRAAELSGVRLESGERGAFRARARRADRVRARVVAAAGTWHPDGGLEFRLTWSAALREVSPGRLELEQGRLGPGPVRIELRGEGEGAVISGVAGAENPEATLVETSSIEGRVRVRGTRIPVVGARVRVGAIETSTDEDGDYRISGLLPGPKEMEITAAGHRGLGALAFEVRPELRIADLDVDLEPMASLSGMARDLDLAGVPGCWVVVEDEDDQVPVGGEGLLVVARSDEEGRFSGARARSGLRRLAAFGAPGLRGTPLETTLLERLDNEVDLRLRRAASGEGRVTDHEGAAAAGVDVFVVAEGAGLDDLVGPEPHGRLRAPRVLHALSDSEGRWRFDGLAPGPVRLVLRSVGRPPVVTESFTLAEGPQRSGLTQRLPRPAPSSIALGDGALRLIATDGSGQEHWLAPSGSGLREVDISELTAGPWRVERLQPAEGPTARADEPLAWPGLHRREGVAIADLPGAVAAPRAFTRVHEVEGRVSFEGEAPGRRPLAAALFPFAAQAGLAPRRVVVDLVDGSWRTELPRGVWVLLAEAPGWGVAVSPPFGVGLDGGDGAVEAVELDVPPAGRLAGAVLPAEAVQGGDAARVELRPKSWGRLRPWSLAPYTALVDPSGAFDLAGIPAGAVDVVLAGGGAAGETTAEVPALGFRELEPLAAQPALPTLGSSRGAGEVETRRLLRAPAGLTLALDGLRGFEHRFLVDARAGAPLAMRGDLGLRGRVRVDLQGLAGAAFEVSPLAGDRYAWGVPGFAGRLDERGAFLAGELTPGDHVLAVTYRGRDGVTYHLRERLGLERGTGRLELEIATGVLEVATLRSVDDRPREGAHVRVYRAEDRGLVGSTVWRRESALVCEGWTDRLGEVRFESLPGGRYDIRANAPGEAEARMLDVEVEARGAPRRAELRFDAPGRLLAEVRDEDGAPVVGARIFLFDDAAAEVRDVHPAWTDLRGLARCDGLAPGAYSVIASAPGRPPQLLGSGLIVANGVARVEGRLERGAEILVRCVDERRRPLAGCVVALVSSAGALRLHGPEARRRDEIPDRADGRGLLRLTDVPPGACEVEAILPGRRPARGTVELWAGSAAELTLELEKISPGERTQRGR